MRWKEIYQTVGNIRHRFDAVAHKMVSDCQGMKDPCPPEVIDELVEELEVALMELRTCQR